MSRPYKIIISYLHMNFCISINGRPIESFRINYEVSENYLHIDTVHFSMAVRNGNVDVVVAVAVAVAACINGGTEVDEVGLNENLSI